VTLSNVPGVLFLCVHNAGRSQMAAGWARALGGEGIVIYSGGSEPANAVNDIAVQAMAEVGVDISAEVPKTWSTEMLGHVDVVVTMGCGDVCPVLPGKRYVDWPLTDPRGGSLELVRSVRDEIRDLVQSLLVSLNVETVRLSS
jgi:arsenate reductase (thioredoxin)